MVMRSEPRGLVHVGKDCTMSTPDSSNPSNLLPVSCHSPSSEIHGRCPDRGCLSFQNHLSFILNSGAEYRVENHQLIHISSCSTTISEACGECLFSTVNFGVVWSLTLSRIDDSATRIKFRIFIVVLNRMSLK